MPMLPIKQLFSLLTVFLFFGNYNLVYTIGIPARQAAKIDQVYATYNLSGQNVVVAMIDRGIDYSHTDFIDANGNTRIAYIFDMIDPSGAGAANNPYGIGTIYDASDINFALQNNVDLGSTDRQGHGTATTSIACGNGTGTADLQFRGVAHKATIISVKLTQDYFPAFGSQPGQAAFYNPSYIATALQFVTDKVAALGLPSVTILNIGSIGGPTDGTSNYSALIDNFVGPGKIFVNGPGDDGGINNRAGGSVNQDETVEILVQKGEVGTMDFDLWYDNNDRFSVTVVAPDNTSYGPFAGPTDNINTTTSFQTDFSIYHYGSEVDPWIATNSKRELFVRIFGQTGLYKIKLTGTTVSNGSFSASINPSNFYAQNNNYFMSHIVAGSSINDFASSFNAVCPTSYVVANTWTDINGIPRSITGEGDPGEIWLGSSAGPTLDGRYGIDVAAPGEHLFAAYSPDTYYSWFDFNMIQAGNSFYGRQSAVSAANPFLAGVIALMLEVNPNLTTAEVQNILQMSAMQDSDTGAVPNNVWGYGKLDALAAIELMQCSDQNIVINDIPIANGTQIWTSATITSAGTVAANNTITFAAGQSISLEPEFTIELGSVFTTLINACGTITPFNNPVVKTNQSLTPIAPNFSFPNKNPAFWTLFPKGNSQHSVTYF